MSSSRDGYSAVANQFRKDSDTLALEMLFPADGETVEIVNRMTAEAELARGVRIRDILKGAVAQIISRKEGDLKHKDHVRDGGPVYRGCAKRIVRRGTGWAN
jgi:hypothetical protein